MVAWTRRESSVCGGKWSGSSLSHQNLLKGWLGVYVKEKSIKTNRKFCGKAIRKMELPLTKMEKI